MFAHTLNSIQPVYNSKPIHLLKPKDFFNFLKFAVTIDFTMRTDIFQNLVFVKMCAIV